MASITSANATFFLTIPGVYPAPVQLQGFGVDDAFAPDAVDIAETQVGVDGYGVGGFMPVPVPMTIRLLASSPSIVVFENWFEAMVLQNDVLAAIGVISQPSVNRKYVMPNGIFQRLISMAQARKILENREFRITWLPGGPGIPAITAAPV